MRVHSFAMVFTVSMGLSTATAAEQKLEVAPPPRLVEEELGLDPRVFGDLTIERVEVPNINIIGVPEGIAASIDPTITLFGVPLNPPLSLGTIGGNSGLMGVGTGGGISSFGSRGRPGEDKFRLTMQNGGSEASELAVARGLAWLARKQRFDGSWEFDGTDKSETTAATGMALLPFLGAGETHKKAHKYRETVDRGIRHLMVQQKPDGSFRNAKTMYAHALAALAIVEAYGMTKDPFLKATAQRAVTFIETAQGPNGSWGYVPKSDGDTSILGWQIQVLHAAKLCKDLNVNPAVLTKANQFLDSVAAGPNKSEYGYRDAINVKPTSALTAVGLLCRHDIAGWGKDHAGMIDGVKGLLERTPRKDNLDAYHLYYATQVMFLFGGESWKRWNEGASPGTGTRDVLIKAQSLKDLAQFGSWEPDQGMIGRSCGRLGTTALTTLTLEVYYRRARSEDLKPRAEVTPLAEKK